MKKILFTLLVAMVALVDTINAQSNPKISIQGILREASGVAVEDGEYDLTFNIYEQLDGGTPIYTEDHTGVSIANGIYSVHLGTYISLGGLPFDKPYFVGVKVGSSELKPRIELTHSPYSMAATSVTCSGAVGDVKYSILGWADFQDVNGDCWVPMDGRSVTGTALEQMFAINDVPDMSGLFIRAHEWNDGNDPLRTPTSAIAQIQEDTIQSHKHDILEGGEHQHRYTDFHDQDGDAVYDDYISMTMTTRMPTQSGINGEDTEPSGDNGANFRFSVSKDTEVTNGNGKHNHTMDPTGDVETRPRNMNFNIYIRVN